MIVRCVAMTACLASAFIALGLCMQKNDGKQAPIWLVSVILIFIAAMGAIAIPDSSLSGNF